MLGIDLIGLKEAEPVLIVQTTSGIKHAARRTKLHAQRLASLWKGAGVSVVVLRAAAIYAARRQ